jgi:AraC family transcriptional regulator
LSDRCRRYQILSRIDTVAVVMRIHGIFDNAIATLHRGPFGKVEIVRCSGAHSSALHTDVASRLHFSLPLAGAFVCHLDGDALFIDPTSVLCTRAGESYRISHPHGGDCTLVFTPGRGSFAHLSQRVSAPDFDRRSPSLIASPRIQMLARTLYVNHLRSRDTLAADECLIELFECIAMQPRAIRLPKDDALVRRTIEFVHCFAEPHLTLNGIASAMSVSASHLTHSFKQRTGMALYQYVMNLKLARALHRLASTDDPVTDIAIDLGFNSHSHFSSAFKARYGLTPSEARVRMGKAPSIEPAPSVTALPWRPLCVARGGHPEVGVRWHIGRLAAG